MRIAAGSTPIAPEDAQRRIAHRVAMLAGAAVAIAGSIGAATTGRLAPAFLTDVGFGVLFAVECVIAERWTRGPALRRGLRASVRAAWGLTFAIWSAFLYTAATRALRAVGVRPSDSPKDAHIDLRTHIEAALVFVVVVALSTVLTALVLSIGARRRPAVRASAKAGAAACAVGGVAALLTFPERAWLTAIGACAAAAVWHAIIGELIFAPPTRSPGRRSPAPDRASELTPAHQQEPERRRSHDHERNR